MKLRPKPTKREFDQYRAEHECGFYDARDGVMMQWRRVCLEDIKLACAVECGSDRQIIGALLELLSECPGLVR